MGRSLESLFERYRRKGDVRALAQVFDRTARDLLALANHLVRDLDDAEDLVQSTFVTAIERAGSYDRTRALLPWLTGILVHSAANHVRRRERRRTDAVPSLAGSAPDPASCAEESELAHSLEKTLGRMGERYRRVLDPYLRSGKTPEEIARELGLAPGTVRTQIHRGLARLRRLLPASVGAGVLMHGGHGLPAIRSSVLEHAAAGSTLAAASIAPGLILGGLVVSKKIALVGACALLAALGTWWTPSEPLEPVKSEPHVAASTPSISVPQLEAPASTVMEPARREAGEVEAEQTTPPSAGRAILRGRVRGVRPEHMATLSLRVRARSADLEPGSRKRQAYEDTMTDLMAYEMMLSDRSSAEAERAAMALEEMKGELLVRFDEDLATAHVRGNGAADEEGLFEIDVTKGLLAAGESRSSAPGMFRVLADHEVYFGASQDVEFGPGALANVARGEVVIADVVIELEPAAVLRGTMPAQHTDMAQMDRLRALELEMVQSAYRLDVELDLRDIEMQRMMFDQHRASGPHGIQVALFRAGEPQPVAKTRSDGSGGFQFKLAEDGPFVLAAVTGGRAPLQLAVDLELAAAVELEDALEFPDGPSIEGSVEDYGAFPEGGLTLEAMRLPSPDDRPIDWSGVDVIWDGETVVRNKATTRPSRAGEFRFLGLSPGQHVLGLPDGVARSFGASKRSALAVQVPVPSTDVLVALPLAIIDLTIQWPKFSKGSGAAHLYTKTGSNDYALAGTRGGRNGTCAVFAEPGQPVSLAARHPGMEFEPWSGVAPARGERLSVTLVGRIQEEPAND